MFPSPLEDTRISLKERLKYHELSNESEITILNSYEFKDDAEEGTINERVERVQSMVAPSSYATPEKIILKSQISMWIVTMSRWMHTFPLVPDLSLFPEETTALGS